MLPDARWRVESTAGLALLTISPVEPLPSAHVAAHVLGALERAHLRPQLLSHSSVSGALCVAIPGRATAVLRAALGDAPAATRVGTRARVLCEGPVAIVSLCSPHMSGHPGVAGRLFAAVARAGVSVLATAQGSDEQRISICVAQGDDERVSAVLRAEFEDSHMS